VGSLIESRLLPLLRIPAQISNNRRRSPVLTASARLTAPSLRNNASTWNLTVCWEMPSRRAAALLLGPSAIAGFAGCQQRGFAVVQRFE
jgi:hypothetical protein